MKATLILLALVGSAFAATDLQWEQFKTAFNKQYATIEEEASRRFNYAQNLIKNAEHNILFDLGLKSFSRGVNEFSDLVSYSNNY